MKLLNYYLFIFFALLGCKDNDDVACYSVPPQTVTLQIVDQENNNLIGENNIYPFDSIKITYNKEQVDVYLDSDSTVSFYYEDTPINQQYLLFFYKKILKKSIFLYIYCFHEKRIKIFCKKGITKFNGMCMIFMKIISLVIMRINYNMRLL